MVVAVVLFLIGAAFGAVVLNAILKNQSTPKPMVYVHGLIQVVAFIILIAAATKVVPAPTLAIVLFAIAAVGGLVLFALDMQGKPLPRALAILHPILGVLGVLALIIYLAGGPRTGTATGVGDEGRPGVPGTTAPQTTAPGTGTGTSGMGTMGGGGMAIGRTTSPDSARLDDDRNRVGTQGTSGIGRTGIDTTGIPRVPTGSETGGRR